MVENEEGYRIHILCTLMLSLVASHKIMRGNPKVIFGRIAYTINMFSYLDSLWFSNQSELRTHSNLRTLQFRLNPVEWLTDSVNEA